MRAAALWRTAGLVVLLAVAGVIPLAKNVTITHVGVFVLLYVGAAVAWNIFSGFTGYISLGAAVFFGTGVYTVALISKHLDLAGGMTAATVSSTTRPAARQTAGDLTVPSPPSARTGPAAGRRARAPGPRRTPPSTIRDSSTRPPATRA